MIKPETIRKARKEAGLTQTKAAELIYCAGATWRDWESGRRNMHRGLFELFLIKTGIQIDNVHCEQLFV